MGFLDKLFGRKKEQEPAPSKPPSPQVETPKTTGSKGEISRVFLYVVANTQVNEATADQIRTFALQQLKADATFLQIWTKVERDQVPVIKGHGFAPNSSQFADAFGKWLKTKGTSLDQAKAVMGKSIFVQGGDSMNPADGSKFSWALVGCFQ